MTVKPLRSLRTLSEPKGDISKIVVDCAFEVHKTIGPGLLESAYEQCLEYEFVERGLNFEKQKALPVLYKGVLLDAGYRLDFIVENCLIVELKSIEKILPVHQAQILSYLKLSGTKTGLLINFNVPLIKDGIKLYSL